MKTATALIAFTLTLAGCVATLPPMPPAGVQFDGNYVGQDTLISGVEFLCGTANLPERIEVQNGRFAYPFQVNPPRTAPLPVQIFEDGTVAGQMQYGTLLEEDVPMFPFPLYRLGHAARAHHRSDARCHDHKHTLRSSADSSTSAIARLQPLMIAGTTESRDDR